MAARFDGLMSSSFTPNSCLHVRYFTDRLLGSYPLPAAPPCRAFAEFNSDGISVPAGFLASRKYRAVFGDDVVRVPLAPIYRAFWISDGVILRPPARFRVCIAFSPDRFVVLACLPAGARDCAITLYKIDFLIADAPTDNVPFIRKSNEFVMPAPR